MTLDFITSFEEKHIDQLTDFCQDMWWSQGRTRDDVLRMLVSSVSLGMVDSETGDLVAYARIFTDFVKFAYLFDVYVHPNYRNQGLAKRLVQALVNDERLSSLKTFELCCIPEHVPFYKQFGFDTDFGKVVPMRYTRT